MSYTRMSILPLSTNRPAWPAPRSRTVGRYSGECSALSLGWSEKPNTCRPGIVHRLDKTPQASCSWRKINRHLNGCLRLSKNDASTKYIPPSPVAIFVLRLGQLSCRSVVILMTKKWRYACMTDARLSALSSHTESSGSLAASPLPETGRTHQLRTSGGHRHPILGDKVYGGNNSHLKGLDPLPQTFPRQALHAEQIEVLHLFPERPACTSSLSCRLAPTTDLFS